MPRTKRKPLATRSASKTPGMTVDVRNFGPIARGQVDLRPLTVFAGPSNTGKSWLATLVYVMVRHISGFHELRRLFREPFLERSIAGTGRRGNNAVQHFPEDPQRWLENLRSHGQVRLTAGETEAVRKVVKDLEGNLENELLRCYGVSKSVELIRQVPRVKMQLSVRSGQIDHCLDLVQSYGMSLDIKMPESVVFSANRNKADDLETFMMMLEGLHRRRSRRGDRHMLDYERPEMMLAIIRNLFLREENGAAYYLPADRGGVMHAHAVVVGALIRRASRAGLSQEPPLPVLSGILSDFLEGLLGVAELGGRRARVRRLRDDLAHLRDDLAQNLEDRILRGKVEMEQGETDYPRFVYRPKDWQRTLPIMNTSSMVSELTPVALYLRYLVRPGDLLIIEEPEAHLHPAMQARFTEEIAGFVKAGVRILLTTHSEWVLEELANIVARGKRKQEGENDKVGLRKEDVGIWLFDFVDKDKPEVGSKITEVPWKRDDGGYMTGFDKVAMALHNDWADLMSESS